MVVCCLSRMVYSLFVTAKIDVAVEIAGFPLHRIRLENFLVKVGQSSETIVRGLPFLCGLFGV